MPAEPILTRIREARAAGHDRITVLGGEPTLQPGFLEIVRATVTLGFREIVLFTNGVKTARPEYIDAVRATGGRFVWRISIQGATRESHERTTRKPGSFGRILESLRHLAARGERITVNMCVVASNYEEVDRFPELLAPFGVEQLHLDMVRPLDAGVRSEEELRGMLPHYPDLVGPLRRMVAGFPEGFDVNVGNLPYCIAPDLAPWIHHDGEPTETVAIDGDDRLSRPWDKYLVKRRDKVKPERCRECVLDERCSGVFETYARVHGTSALGPIKPAALREVDPRGRLLGVWAPALLPECDVRVVSDHEVIVDGRARLRGRVDEAPPPDRLAEHAHFTVHRAGPLAPAELAPLAEALARLSPPHQPLGVDAVGPLPARLAAAVHRLRAAAPFGALRWTALRRSDDRLELDLEAPDGATAVFWVGPTGAGYRPGAAASDALVEGLRTLRAALVGPRAGSAAR